MSKSVFIVGKLPGRNRDLPDLLRAEGYDVTVVGGGEETLRLLKGERCCELAVVGEPDDISPRALLSGLGRRHPGVRGILLQETPSGSSLLKEDSLDLSGKTSGSVAEAIRGILATREEEVGPVRLLGRSPAIERIRQTVDQVAPTSMTVLITGESGTGKDVVARLIHQSSRRRERPYVAVNCAALPEGVLESELFGHEKGAFTGATSRREGRFELAHRGTLFLDEIGDIPVQTQAKLLRVLEEKKFFRVGGVKDVEADVRLLAATNADLEGAVRDGRFREDLFYRLNVIQIHIPPLRDRREDIPDLVRTFVAGSSADHGTERIRFTPEALDYLASFHWPGNVRQLRNLIEKIAILESGGEIGLDGVTRFLGEGFSRSRNLPVPARGGSDRAERELIYQNLLAIRSDLAELKEMFRGTATFTSPAYSGRRPARFDPEAEVLVPEEPSPEAGEGRTAADFEREAIRRALEESGGNRRRAAEILEIGERTLYRKLKKYGLD
ncbi:MAG: sigma-54 dependent transcriptional regulator [Candidatus Eisenbacteria bacterium]